RARRSEGGGRGGGGRRAGGGRERECESERQRDSREPAHRRRNLARRRCVKLFFPSFPLGRSISQAPSSPLAPPPPPPLPGPSPPPTRCTIASIDARALLRGRSVCATRTGVQAGDSRNASKSRAKRSPSSRWGQCPAPG